MSERSVAAAFGDVLVRLAGERPNLLLVAGADPGPAVWFADIWPERVLTVGPLATRVGVAEGIAVGGGDALVVLDGEVAELPVPADARVVCATTDPGHLHLAFRAGVGVCAPGWAADLPALLVGALGADGPTVLYLPDHDAADEADPGAPPPPTTFAEQRVLHRGPAGLVLGAGRTAPLARSVADGLARRRIEVTALDLHTISPGTGVDAGLLHDHLLVGPATAPRAAAMDAVPVADRPLRELVAAVATALGHGS